MLRGLACTLINQLFMTSHCIILITWLCNYYYYYYSIQSEVGKTVSEEAIFGEVEDNGENIIMVQKF